MSLTENYRWFRFYHEALDDPKVQKLSPKLFKNWINLLCLAARNEGKITAENVAFALRLTDSKALEILTDLQASGLIDVSPQGYRPHNWEMRQFKSDSSTERVQRFREQKRNVTETLHETGPDTDTEQIQNRVKGDPAPAEKRGARRDEAADHFQARCLELTGAPYIFSKPDFVHLSKLRKAYGIGTAETPDGWTQAVTFYFDSALGKNSMADLCVRYSVFHYSPIDGFGKPINHRNRGNGNGAQGKADRTAAATRSVLRALDQQNRSGSERGIDSGNSGGLPGIPTPPIKR